MADTSLVSYSLAGVKESFANWVSNLSPTETPFVSMTGKEAVTNKLFQWQTDKLAKADTTNAVIEGSDAEAPSAEGTTVVSNRTQILRKVVKVTDTANALVNYGRGQELQYQMEKAGKEIKRDLEAILLSSQGVDEGKSSGTGTNTAGAADAAAKTAAFQALCGTGASPEGTTSDYKVVRYVLNQSSGANQFKLQETDIFDVTNALYLAGSNANIIMFHPKHAKFFSGLMEATNGTRQRMFDGASDTKVNVYVSSLVDPLGQEYKLIPNRFMPEDAIYFFNPSDWTQMVLRAPERTKLAKQGSSEKWMIEMEVGLRHRNPYASGILFLKTGTN